MTGIALAEAREAAAVLVETLRPACERIEVAGSVRRGVARVKDIEIVAIPRVRHDLFGEVLDDELDVLVRRLVDDGALRPRLDSRGIERMGRRYKALTVGTPPIAVDLFAVLPPAQWGALFAIRTGPGDFSRRLVTACQARGLRCTEGRLVYGDGTVLSTPEEVDFFRACGVPWVEPGERR